MYMQPSVLCDQRGAGLWICIFGSLLFYSLLYFCLFGCGLSVDYTPENTILRHVSAKFNLTQAKERADCVEVFAVFIQDFDRWWKPKIGERL